MLDKYLDRAGDGCICREIDGETVILSRDAKWLHIINEVGSEVWGLADGSMTVKEIIFHICEEFDVSIDAAGQDVLTFIQKLLAKNLICLREEPRDALAE